ncbi:HIRAN domain-containing protein [Myxococcus xanthus]|uniref:HIRAN domain-containing protein n=1 Tax=Myxococcus xanthus TaxID=34 RepID=A0A7Y4IMK7_MYXXA|nr:HIRAN domain-containing protein [Myxococcus xanthus]NOJ81919.1 hypothetical protein [Myxococcus xanthus]NOJ89343.1 hypothetical protein [Myxococcus xanthus]
MELLCFLGSSAVVCGVSVYLLGKWLNRRRAAAASAPVLPTAPQGKLTSLPRGAVVEVVGESNYQDALEALAEERTRLSQRIATTAHLVRERTNRFDANAVAVLIEGRLVGYLSRADAVSFRPLIETMEDQGEVAACAATIVGGWSRGERGSGKFGVKLDVVHPDKAPAEATIISHAVTGLWEAKGPAGRRKVVQRALESLRTEEAKTQLLNEASSVEVVSALEQAAGLKTPAAKRRRIQSALDALRADEVPDELQRQQVEWLEAALRDLDAPREAEPGA